MKKRKVPHTFVIVFFIIVVAAVLTWIIPPGKYVSEQVGGETVMTFYYADQLPEAQAAEFHAEPQTWQRSVCVAHNSVVGLRAPPSI